MGWNCNTDWGQWEEYSTSLQVLEIGKRRPICRCYQVEFCQVSGEQTRKSCEEIRSYNITTGNWGSIICFPSFIPHLFCYCKLVGVKLDVKYFLSEFGKQQNDRQWTISELKKLIYLMCIKQVLISVHLDSLTSRITSYFCVWSYPDYALFFSF